MVRAFARAHQTATWARLAAGVIHDSGNRGFHQTEITFLYNGHGQTQKQNQSGR